MCVGFSVRKGDKKIVKKGTTRYGKWHCNKGGTHLKNGWIRLIDQEYTKQKQDLNVKHVLE